MRASARVLANLVGHPVPEQNLWLLLTSFGYRYDDVSLPFLR